MRNLSNGDELRFPVEMWLERTDENPEIALELPSVWPDIPPVPCKLDLKKIFCLKLKIATFMNTIL